ILHAPAPQRDPSRFRTSQAAGDEMACAWEEIRRNTCNLPLIRLACLVGGGILASILVVDDDIAVQAVMRLLLEQDGHEVSVASNGLKGLKTFETGNFDLLIVDI